MTRLQMEADLSRFVSPPSHSPEGRRDRSPFVCPDPSLMTRAMQPRAHGVKRLNHLEHRATETEVAHSSASVVQPTPSPTTKLATSLPPTSITALAAVLSVIGAVIVIVAIALWKYRSRKHRNTHASPSLAGKVSIRTEYHSEKHIDLENVSIYTEKPEKAVLTPRSFDTQVGWVPQTKGYPAVTVTLPEPTASPKSKTKSPNVPLFVKTPSKSPLDSARSPPPSYFLDNGGSEAEAQSPRLIPVPPSPAVSTDSTPTPPTPPANRRTKASFVSLSEQHPLPAPSPRSESFAAHDLVHPRDSVTDELGRDQKLPRLMSVAANFTPSLDDELAIKSGDTVRMLDEYRDGWCLVQRVGRIDAPKGAVPRFCLQERRGVVPILPTRKFSNGSLKSPASGWR